MPESTGAAKKPRACLPCEDMNGVRLVSQASLCRGQLSSSGNSLFPRAAIKSWRELDQEKKGEVEEK